MMLHPQSAGEGVLRLLGSPDHLAARLEEELVGPGVLALVRDLETVMGSGEDASPPPSDLRDRILNEGLQALTDNELQSVLARPRTLLELHKSILVRGSEYWDAVMRRADTNPTSPETIPAPVRVRRVPRWASHILTAATAAAVVFVAMNHQIRERSDDLRDVRAENGRLRDELRSIPSVVPADLPESTPDVLPADPGDLPEGDPADLPESPKTRATGV